MPLGGLLSQSLHKGNDILHFRSGENGLAGKRGLDAIESLGDVVSRHDRVLEKHTRIDDELAQLGLVVARADPVERRAEIAMRRLAGERGHPVAGDAVAFVGADHDGTALLRITERAGERALDPAADSGLGAARPDVLELLEVAGGLRLALQGVSRARGAGDDGQADANGSKTPPGPAQAAFP